MNMKGRVEINIFSNLVHAYQLKSNNNTELNCQLHTSLVSAFLSTSLLSPVSAESVESVVRSVKQFKPEYLRVEEVGPSVMLSGKLVSCFMFSQ